MFKRFLSFLTAFCLTLGMVSAASMTLCVPALATDVENCSAISQYYGSQLTDPAAIAFYNALQTMDFTTGESVKVTDEAILAEAQQYESGDMSIAESFGTALDAFFMDQTDLFYVDWDNFSFSVGKVDGTYVVTLSAGRAESYLKVSDSKLDSMIAEYDSAVEETLTEIAATLSEDSTAREKAAAVNKWIIDNVNYGFAKDDNGDETEATAYVRTVYGTLVNDTAICEGYARTFKHLMNLLDVQCELVGGYLIQGDSVEPHLWNYVQDEEGDWYAVDVTGNDTCESEKLYFWRTEEVFFANHMEDPIISTSGYEMPYPELRKFWETPTSSGLFDVKMAYSPSGYLSMAVSYDGMNATELRDTRGLYMAFRVSTTNESGVPDTTSSPWQSFEMYKKTYNGIYEEEPGTTYFMAAGEHIWNIEVAIFDCADNTVWSTVTNQMYYNQDAIDTHMVEMTTVYNPCNDPDYKVPAYIDYEETTPARLFQERQDITQTQHITIAYDTDLVLMDGCTESDFTVTYDVQAYNNRDLVKEKVFANAKIENIEWDGANKVSFDFTPSRSYNHNMIWYQFSIEGLTNELADGTASNIPIPTFPIAYAYTDTIACKSILSSANPYMKAYAQPTLTSIGDLSMEGWTYPDGTKVCEAERSQMALVVTTPNDSAELAEAAENLAGTGAVLRSYTYEIDLNVCGSIVSIPNGTKLTLNLGIPDSVNLSDPNTVFKLYHFHRNTDGTLDYDNPEIIDCAVTEYGIIALVDSFSPYVLVALDNSQLADEDKVTNKSIVVNVVTSGGSVTSTGILSGALLEGETVTYTVTPDEGYAVEYVTVNGTVTELSENGTLTIDYNTAESSTVINVGFVANSVLEAEAEEGITHVIANVETKPEQDEPENPEQEEAKYTVTYDANGGTGEITDENEYKTGDKFTVKENAFALEGYVFTGWNTSKDGTGETIQVGTEYEIGESNVVLYAQWTAEPEPDPEPEPEKVTYSVGYNANGGTGELVDEAEYEAGDTFTAKENSFTREGYTFTGWNTAEDGSGEDIQVGAEYKIGESSITLYAQWEKVSTDDDTNPDDNTEEGNEGTEPNPDNPNDTDESKDPNTDSDTNGEAGDNDTNGETGDNTNPDDDTNPGDSSGNEPDDNTDSDNDTEEDTNPSPDNDADDTPNSDNGTDEEVNNDSNENAADNTDTSSGSNSGSSANTGNNTNTGSGISAGIGTITTGGNTGSNSNNDNEITLNNPTVAIGGNSKGGSVEIDDDGTVTIIPDEGYEISKVIINGEEADIPEDCKLTGLGSEDEVEITFAKISVPVTEKFADIFADMWYKDAVQYVVDNELFYGTSETTFDPDSNMTRGMLTTVLYRLENEPLINAENAFDDVQNGKYYTEAIVWASEAGIITGYGDGSFGPDDSITREQLVTILWRYADSPDSTETLCKFGDAGETSSWAEAAFRWAVESGIITGRTDDTLAPKGNATRAEVATILMRYCKLLENSAK